MLTIADKGGREGVGVSQFHDFKIIYFLCRWHGVVAWSSSDALLDTLMYLGTQARSALDNDVDGALRAQQ